MRPYNSPPPMNQSTKSILLAAVAILCWSTVATAFKIALGQLTVFNMLLIACVTSALIFAVTLTVQGKWSDVASLKPVLAGRIALMGLLNPVCYYLVLFKSYDMLPAQVAQPVNYAWPVLLLVLLAIFDGQHIPARKYIGMAISIGGVACISMGGGSTIGHVSMAGIGVGLLSALLWACYWMLNNRLKGEVDATVSLFLSFLSGSIVLALAGAFIGINIPSTSALLAGVYIGVFEMGIPFLAFGMALRITDNPTLINQLCYLSPFLSLFFIGLVLGEPIAPSTCIGLVLIVGGLVFNQYRAESRLRTKS